MFVNKNAEPHHRADSLLDDILTLLCKKLKPPALTDGFMMDGF